MARTTIIPPERVRRTFDRLAAQILERNRGAEHIDLFGVVHKGAAVAGALAAAIREMDGRAVPVHPLDVTPFRDDRPDDTPPPPDPDVDVTERDVILIDDVLFTGRTIRAALDAVVRYGRPRSIQLVVLIDRGHREVPIQPDYVGRVIPTKHKERIFVDVEDGFAVHVEE